MCISTMTAGVDDLVSLLLLLQMPEARVTGVSVVDGDCQIEAALEASRKIIDLFGGKQAALEVAASDSRPHHQFPSEWRGSAFTFDALPMLERARRASHADRRASGPSRPGG